MLAAFHSQSALLTMVCPDGNLDPRVLSYSSEIVHLTPQKSASFVVKKCNSDVHAHNAIFLSLGYFDEQNASAHENHPMREKGDFHARSRFALSTIPEDKWGTTPSLNGIENSVNYRTGSCY